MVKWIELSEILYHNLGVWNRSLSRPKSKVDMNDTPDAVQWIEETWSQRNRFCISTTIIIREDLF